MQSIRKFVAPEIVFGDGALEMLGRYVTNFGANRVFVVTDPGVVGCGLADKVVRNLRTVDVEAVL